MIELAPGNDRRLGEVIALEQGEAELQALRHLFARVDFFGEQGFAQWFQFDRQLIELDGRQWLDVDLDDVDQGEQFGELRFELDDVVQRQSEARRLQGAAALDDRRRGGDGFEDFEDDGLAGQEFEHVAEQEVLVDIDEAAAIAQRRLDAQFAEGVGDDGRRGPHAASDLRRIAAAVAKQEFVGMQLLITIKNGLAPKEKLISSRGHVKSSER